MATTTPSFGTTSATPPQHVRFIVPLTAVHSIRILLGAAAILLTLFAAAPSIFLITGFGDFLAGLASPFVAFRLARRASLASWTLAIVWNSLGLADIITGNVLAILVPGKTSVSFPPALSLFSICLTLAHIASLVLLLRQPLRDYYTGIRRG